MDASWDFGSLVAAPPTDLVSKNASTYDVLEESGMTVKNAHGRMLDGPRLGGFTEFRVHGPSTSGSWPCVTGGVLEPSILEA